MNDKKDIDKLFKIKLPKSWTQIPSPLPGQYSFHKKSVKLYVMVGFAEYHHNFKVDKWMHVSLSHTNKIPHYRHVKEVKDIFVGKDRKAIQVFPAEKEHVNIHKYCLHLWCNLTSDIFPDFTAGMGTI